MKHSELILAVRRADVDPALAHGFSPKNFPAAFQWLESCGLWLGPRRLLETEPSYLQIIPYLILSNGAGFLCYERSKSGGEKRLHGERSIGIGGHVDAVDVEWSADGSRVLLRETLADGGFREVNEEVGWKSLPLVKWLGVVYDDHAEVGRVHVGIVGLVITDGPVLVTPEHSIADPHMRSVDELESMAGELESWSRMIVESGVLREAVK